MKKFLLTFVAALGLAATANAQLPEGSVFPDFTLYDINGNVHNLYTDLNSGKTVFIDISATWCPPCWAYHNTHALDSLYAKHGPTGLPGVDATTTNDVVVLFVQGEATSHLAELYGDYANGAIPYTTTELPYAQVTQGNWVAGTLYPIIDDTTSSAADGTAALDAAWHIAYFPTVYMICRDHLVHVMSQPTEAQAYAAATGVCPTYAPSATTDAKATAYMGNNYYACNANPSVSFQNYSLTNNITSATINIKDATGAVVATQSWTGTLAPYAVANVTIPSFAGTSFGGYKYSVTVTGDSNPANDVSADSVFKVYDVANAASIPASESFGGNLPYKENLDNSGYTFPGYTSTMVGPNGSVDTALVFEFPYESTGATNEFVFGNFNTASTTGLNLQFDVAYAQINSSSNDNVSVKVSTNCGSTWTSLWSESGSTLSTTAMDPSSEYIPSASSQWKHVTVSLSSATSTNTLIKFTGTAGAGNDAWIDNIRIAATTAVAQVSPLSGISISPNPAKDNANVNIVLSDEATVNVQVYDALGRVVNTITTKLSAGEQNIELSTSNLASGLYNVKISSDNFVTTKQLSVIK